MLPASQSVKSRNKLLKKHAVKSPGRSDRWVGFNGIEGLEVWVWFFGYPPGATCLGFRVSYVTGTRWPGQLCREQSLKASPVPVLFTVVILSYQLGRLESLKVLE